MHGYAREEHATRSLGKPLVDGEEDKALRAVFVGSQPEVDC
jgi:hypothetical protein